MSNKACRFGDKCNRQGCKFQHSNQGGIGNQGGGFGGQNQGFGGQGGFGASSGGFGGFGQSNQNQGGNFGQPNFSNQNQGGNQNQNFRGQGGGYRGGQGGQRGGQGGGQRGGQGGQRGGQGGGGFRSQSPGGGGGRPCNFGMNCKKAQCTFQHPPGWSPQGGGQGSGSFQSQPTSNTQCPAALQLYESSCRGNCRKHHILELSGVSDSVRHFLSFAFGSLDHLKIIDCIQTTLQCPVMILSVSKLLDKYPFQQGYLAVFDALSGDILDFRMIGAQQFICQQVNHPSQTVRQMAPMVVQGQAQQDMLSQIPGAICTKILVLPNGIIGGLCKLINPEYQDPSKALQNSQNLENLRFQNFIKVSSSFISLPHQVVQLDKIGNNFVSLSTDNIVRFYDTDFKEQMIASSQFIKQNQGSFFTKFAIWKNFVFLSNSQGHQQEFGNFIHVTMLQQGQGEIKSVPIGYSNPGSKKVENMVVEGNFLYLITNGSIEYFDLKNFEQNVVQHAQGKPFSPVESIRVQTQDFSNFTVLTDVKNYKVPQQQTRGSENQIFLFGKTFQKNSITHQFLDQNVAKITLADPQLTDQNICVVTLENGQIQLYNF